MTSRLLVRMTYRKTRESWVHVTNILHTARIRMSMSGIHWKKFDASGQTDFKLVCIDFPLVQIDSHNHETKKNLIKLV